MSGRFAGQVVLITGAARGFGAAAAEAFAAEGAKLLLSDISSDVEAVAERLGARASVGDVSAPEYHKTLVNRAKSKWGHLDIAVNNAGIAHAPAPLPAVDEATIRRVIEVDLLGVLWAHQAQIPVMAGQGGGVIVNVASAAGLSPARPGLGPTLPPSTGWWGSHAPPPQRRRALACGSTPFAQPSRRRRWCRICSRRAILRPKRTSYAPSRCGAWRSSPRSSGPSFGQPRRRTVS